PQTGKVEKVGPGFQETITAAEAEGGTTADFELYMVAKHGLDVQALRNAEAAATGEAPLQALALPEADLQAIVKDIETPAFQRANQILQDFNNEFRGLLEEAGFADPGFAEQMALKYPNWVPLARVMMEQIGPTGGAGGRRTNTPELIRRLRGSGRPVKSPLDELQRRLRLTLELAQLWRGRCEYVDMTTNVEGMGWMAERVTPKSHGTTISPDEMARFFRQMVSELIDADGMGDQMTPDLVSDIMGSPTVWRTVMKGSVGENVLPVIRPGYVGPRGAVHPATVELWQVAPEVFPVFVRPDPYNIPGQKILGIIKDVQRNLNTTLRPLFAYFRNFVRDVPTMVMQAPGFGPGRLLTPKGWADTVTPFAKAIYEIAGRGEEFEAMRWAGAFQGEGGDLSLEPSVFGEAWQKAARRLGRPATAVGKATRPLRWMGRKYLRGGSNLERYTRMVAALDTLRAKTEGGMPYEDALVEAALVGRESTVPFERGGLFTKAMNRVVQFFGARVQGPYTAYRAFRANPRGVVAKGLWGISLATLLNLAWVYDNPDWQQLPAWRKYTGLNIPLYKDEKGETRFLWVPAPWEWFVVFGIPVIAAAEYIRTKNPDVWRDAASAAVRSTSPLGDVGDIKEAGSSSEIIMDFLTSNVVEMIPSAARPLVENAFNQNWLGRDIVPYYEQKKAPRLQVADYSSEVSRLIGERLNYSPRRIDHLLRGYGGGLMTDALILIDAGAAWAGVGKRPASIRDNPMLRLVAMKASDAPAALDNFYAEMDRLERADSEADAGGKTMSAADKQRLSQARSLQRELSTITKDMRKLMAGDEAAAVKRQKAVPYMAKKMGLLCEFTGDEVPEWAQKHAPKKRAAAGW
ncbi:MAG TPA: LPD38 domain-containing protein, partial [Armatimonadota bacterium]|nr:LPD38 domain-containing protein [Armatimonadota bacterium]